MLAPLTRACALGALLLSLASCQPPEKECLESARARDHEGARRACAEVMAEAPTPEVALALARAHSHFGDHEAALALVPHAHGSRVEGAMLRLAAKLHGRRGSVEAGRRALEEALAVDQRLGLRGESARDAQALAGVVWRQGDYQEALRWLAVAREAASAAEDARLSGFVMLAEGSVRYELGDARGAERVWRAAAKALPAAGDQAWAVLKLGRLRLEEGRYALAEASLEKARGLAAAEGRNDLTRSIALNLSIVAMETDRLDEADRHMATVDAALAKVPDARFQVTRDVFMGGLRRRQGRLAEAREALARAERGVPQPELGWRVAMEQGRVARLEGKGDEAVAAWTRAIELIEGMRGGLKADELKGWFLEAKAAPYAALFALHAEAGRPWAALAVQERALARMFTDAFITRTTGAGRSAYLKALLPALKASEALKPTAIEAIREALSGHTVIGWFPEGDRLWWVRVERGVPDLRPLPTSLPDVRKRVGALLNVLESAEATAGAAQALGEALIPADVVLPPGRVYVVVPGEPLSRVPFALLRHRGQVLVAEHAVAQVPGLTTLAALQAAESGPTTAPVVIGDGRGDLPGAAREVKAVAERVGASALSGPAATTDALRAGARAEVMHVATHVSVGPAGAALILHDGPVETQQIMAWGLRPELVILTGCASGAARGEGLWGSVASAFLAAGTKGAVAALWSVEDEAARRFATLFYEGGSWAGRAPEAVARAQRALMAEGYAPKDWAPFVVIGR